MKLNVRFFAQARDIAGAECVRLDVPPSQRSPDFSTVAELRETLAHRFPDMAALIPNLLIAVGTDYADNATRLAPGSDVACFPPVSGG